MRDATSTGSLRTTETAGSTAIVPAGRSAVTGLAIMAARGTAVRSRKIGVPAGCAIIRTISGRATAVRAMSRLACSSGGGATILTRALPVAASRCIVARLSFCTISVKSTSRRSRTFA